VQHPTSSLIFPSSPLKGFLSVRDEVENDLIEWRQRDDWAYINCFGGVQDETGMKVKMNGILYLRTSKAPYETIKKSISRPPTVYPYSYAHTHAIL